MITNIKREGSRIYGEVKDKYLVSYDPRRDDYQCDCMGFTILQKCKHIKELKRIIEVLNEKD